MKTDKNMFDPVIGQSLGPRRMDYTWRDVILYALGVGAHDYDLSFVYEKAKGGLKAYPSFALTPYLNSILMEPKRNVPYTPATIVDNFVIDKLGGEVPNRLHMAMELFMHNKIDPMCGSFVCEDKVDNVYDRGEGKGIAIQTKMDVYDNAGRPIATCKSTHAVFAFGGFGGEKADSRKLEYPDREPDFAAEDHIAPTQALLYRLMGDTYDVHVDYDLARSYGYERPFIQGLCTWGFACRMGISKIIPGEPERMTHMYAQMRNVVFTDTDVRYEGWKIEEGKVYFRLTDSNGKLLLGNGVFEYE